MKFKLLLIALLFSSCGQTHSIVREAWDNNNSPFLMNTTFQVNYKLLPKQGYLSGNHPWSETFWPSTDAGIARRWQTPHQDPFTYLPPDREHAVSMTSDELKVLSPAEKYDIYMGRFDYPLVREERERTSPNARLWEGLCHGWAPASLQFAEPHKIWIRGPSGIEIPFGASDIKALLLYNQGVANPPQRNIVGSRCDAVLIENPSAATQPECKDVNAASFHIVTSNLLGLRHTGFVADLDREWMIWNHPVFAFESKELSTAAPYPLAAPGTTRIVHIETTLHYATEGLAHYNAVLGTPSQREKVATYQYSLELNNAGDIVGGEWDTDDHPDFLWTQSPAPFTGSMSGLKEIYRASQQNGESEH